MQAADPAENPVLHDALAACGERIGGYTAHLNGAGRAVAAARAGPHVALVDEEAVQAAAGEVAQQSGAGCAAAPR